MDITQELQEISELLDLCEQKEGENGLKEWFKELADKKNGFIRYLIDEIIFDPPSFDLIKILYQIQVRCNKKVCKQISQNPEFVNNLSSLLNKVEINDEFLNFLNVFIIYLNFGKGIKINRNLYLNIINSVNWIKSDEVLDFALEAIGDNLTEFKKVFFKHKDATFIIQLLLSKLNRSEGFVKLKNFDNFAVIIKENMNFCYTTDLMVLCDILLSVFDNRNKVAYHSAIKILESLYFDEEFSALKYKVRDILEALEEVKKENFHISPQLIERLYTLISE